jgi:hypothetical protein
MNVCSTWCVRAAVVGLALFGVVGAAAAQSPSPAAVATARQLIDLKGVGNLYDPVLTGIVLRARDALLQSNPMIGNDLNVVAQQMRREFQPRLEALKQQIATFYAARFTEQELKDALAFYKSPLGAKLVTAEPQILDQSMGYADKWAGELGEEVLAKMRAEMRKKGHDL